MYSVDIYKCKHEKTTEKKPGLYAIVTRVYEGFPPIFLKFIINKNLYADILAYAWVYKVSNQLGQLYGNNAGIKFDGRLNIIQHFNCWPVKSHEEMEHCKR